MTDLFDRRCLFDCSIDLDEVCEEGELCLCICTIGNSILVLDTEDHRSLQAVLIEENDVAFDQLLHVIQKFDIWRVEKHPQFAKSIVKIDCKLFKKPHIFEVHTHQRTSMYT